jgi:hypothetical protein
MYREQTLGKDHVERNIRGRRSAPARIKVAKL